MARYDKYGRKLMVAQATIDNAITAMKEDGADAFSTSVVGRTATNKIIAIDLEDGTTQQPVQPYERMNLDALKAIGKWDDEVATAFLAMYTLAFEACGTQEYRDAELAQPQEQLI